MGAGFGCWDGQETSPSPVLGSAQAPVEVFGPLPLEELGDPGNAWEGYDTPSEMSRT